MDPLSALLVVSSVVTFVDFGSKLISRVFEIRSSAGSCKTAVNLHESAQELSSVASDAEKKIQDLETSYPRGAESLARLRTECIETENHLKSALKRLTATPTASRFGFTMPLPRLKSQTQVALRSLWSEKEFDEWAKKLNRIRDEVMMNVLMYLWDEAQQARQQMEHVNDSVGGISEVVLRIETSMKDLKGDFQKITAGHQVTDSSAHERFVNAFWASSGLLDLPTHCPDSSFTPSVSPIPRPTASEIFQNVIASLSFEGMANRSESIVTAYPNTFGWLFRAEGRHQTVVFQGQNFLEWLQSDDERVFWVTGIPASGKSTLMKFITTHKALKQHLRTWAGASELLIASHYFWGPGSRIQKSLVGLLRSLLHQLLSQRPDLCEFVAPRRGAIFKIIGIRADTPPWDWIELQACLLRFAAAIQGRSRLALFIDGLDEFDGNHEELVAFLKQLHRNCDIKLCVSSRPWNIFSDEFKQSPFLRMQELTKSDIDIYIEGKFGSNIAIQELFKVDPGSIAKLMNEIRERADGVFLWVVLVVEQIRMKARDSPRLDEIWEIFNSLPGDLEKLYDAIHKDLEPAKLEMASKLYRLVMEWKRTWNNQMEATLLWCAANCSNPAQRISYPDANTIPDIIPLTTRLLEGHTKGILQICTLRPGRSLSNHRLWTADFLHRTAFDWLRTEDKWNQVCALSPGFHPLLPLIAVLVSHLRSLGPAQQDSSKWHHQRRKESLFRILELTRQVPDASGYGDILTTIFDQISADRLLPLDVKSYFSGSRIPTIGRRVVNPLETLAAAWGCLAYLETKCNAGRQILHIKITHRLRLFLPNRPLPVSLLEASVLGSYFDDYFGYPRVWKESRRMDTVKFLLQKGARPSSSLKLKIRNGLMSEDLPDIDRHRRNAEFPEYHLTAGDGIIV